MLTTSPDKDPDFTGRDEPVFDMKLIAPNLRFIREDYGPEVEEQLYEVWGISREETRERNRWITYDCALALNKAMVEVTGDPEVTYKAGLRSSETSELGAVYYAAKLLATTRLIYTRFPTWGKSMTNITEYELLDISDNEARFEFRVKEGYPDHPLFDAKRKGILASIPLSQGLPPAEIIEEQCINEGAPTCIYRVRWTTPGSKYRFMSTMTVLGTALGLGSGFLLPGHPALWAVGGLFAGLGLGGLRRMARRARLALDKTRMQEGQIGTLEGLIHTQRDQATRLQTLREISDLLHRSTGERELIATATERICKRLRFERVIYWRAENDRLMPAGGAGIAPELAAAMGELWLPLKPSTEGRPLDLPLFGRVLESGEGQRINDVGAYRDQLTPRGQALLDRISPGPFVVVPVRSEGVGVGVLAADRPHQGAGVSDADQSMLEQVANQLGLALDNVRMLESLRQQKQELENNLMLTEKFSQYLQPNVVQRLRENPSERLEIGGTTIRASVLFSDIKGFTEWAEGRESAEVVDCLNQYFREMDAIIARTGGILDKRMGDGLMVVFLHPPGSSTDLFEAGLDDEDTPRHPAERALEAALDMQREARRQAELGADSGFPGKPIRVGVAHGWVHAGNIGSEHRIEYTVMGDTVNVASRLEHMCTPGSVFTTRLTLHNAGASQFPATPLGPTKLKGRKEPVQVMRLLTDDEIEGMGGEV